MRLTPVLRLPPVFHYWKDFGAGKKRRITVYRYWRRVWKLDIGRTPIEDFTLTKDQLPPGSRILDAEDIVNASVAAMPDDIIRSKNEPKTVFDHPWPFNYEANPMRTKTPYYFYSIASRFFVPRDDSLVLTNSVMMNDQMKAGPIFEPTDEHLEMVQRQYDWATKGDNILNKLPRVWKLPGLNRKPTRTYGIHKERQETHVLNSLDELSQTFLAQHYHAKTDHTDKLDQMLRRRSIAFPLCNASIVRQSETTVFNLCIDLMSTSNIPIQAIDPNPESTREMVPVDIAPRTWKSLLEKSRLYPTNWDYHFPSDACPHTIYLASRTNRIHRDNDEMLARCLIHAFALSSQIGRLRSMPVVLQVVGFDLNLNSFHFLRYQLNTLEFDDSNPSRIKNQAWYSGPIKDLGDAFRFFLDFNQSTKCEDLR